MPRHHRYRKGRPRRARLQRRVRGVGGIGAAAGLAPLSLPGLPRQSIQNECYQCIPFHFLRNQPQSQCCLSHGDTLNGGSTGRCGHRRRLDHLRVKPELAELNFWSPSATNFRALEPGELFLFKLHAPRNFIVGGGVFAYANSLPCSLAWEAFGESNGANSLIEMRARIAKYRRVLPNDRTDFAIGCRILTQPFFLPEQRWIPMPESWSSNIVSFKGYSTDEADGLERRPDRPCRRSIARVCGRPGAIRRTDARSAASRTRRVPHTCDRQLPTALRSIRRKDTSSIGRRPYSSLLGRRCS
jgi:hypothetical protein